MNRKKKICLCAALVATSVLRATPNWAQTDAERIAELEAKTTAMAEALQALQKELAAAKEAGSMSGVEELRSEIVLATRYAEQAVVSANEWKNTMSATHLAGYASADYIEPEDGTGAYTANFNPIFHYLYGDRLLWESELAIELDENGEAVVELEYSNINMFLNDYLILVAGKFQSPLGQFRQNLHPSWINKFASAPPGFGHDGAAPAADIGLQLRGGVNVFGNRTLTYAGYVANGPKLIGEDGEIHGIETEGIASDPDDAKIVGGRLSLLPLPRLEFGVSAAFGDAAVVENNGMDLVGDPDRDYEVFGIDASYQWNNLDLRSEYIMQDIAGAESSAAPEGGKWESWYLQSAYKFGDQAKWEGVIRYTDFTSPHADETQEQWAFGLNYLVTPNALIKLGYELNDGLRGEATDGNRWLLQAAYAY